MRKILTVLDASGDFELKWDPENEKETEEARRGVMDLKSRGYSFFLADGTQAPDEVTAGHGVLNVRRIEAEELIAAAPAAEPEKPRRGRKPAARTQQAVAVSPLRGG